MSVEARIPYGREALLGLFGGNGALRGARWEVQGQMRGALRRGRHSCAQPAWRPARMALERGSPPFSPSLVIHPSAASQS